MTTKLDDLKVKIFAISDFQSFESLAIELFEFQYEYVETYRKYCDLLKRNAPKTLQEIPFLPIETFKSHEVVAQVPAANFTNEVFFMSSGTTGAIRSKHRVLDPSLYQQSAITTFENHFGSLSDMVVCALLPNYLQQGNSSLVYMVDLFIKQTRDTRSGFFLDDVDTMLKKIQSAKQEGKKVFLFGVSYALLDLAEQNVDLSGVYVLETGGMKGRRKELPKEELHAALKSGLKLTEIYSEYGMTELLSQAYCKNDEPFQAPPWMRILIRDERDPLTFLPENSDKSGGVSVIDLANVLSCAFIHTQDLGKYKGSGFQLLGRFDHADIRGCNQLVW
jgi:phenylacetate-coenzyme A ligase PaaK-like adenylate-forming protein